MNYEDLRHQQDEHHIALINKYIPSKVESATSVDSTGFKFVVQHYQKNHWHQWTRTGCIPLPVEYKNAYLQAKIKTPTSRIETDKMLLATYCEMPERPLYTRAMLPNEVLFESDSEDFCIQRIVANRILEACQCFGWAPLLCWTGGKSLHIHLWLNLASIGLGPLLDKHLDRVSASMPTLSLRTKIPQLVRTVIFENVLRKAELQDTQLLDEAVVKYQSRRMVRTLGARHTKTGNFKVFLPSVPMKTPDAREPSFPEHLPPLADLTPLAATVRAHIIIELDRLSQKRKHRSSIRKSSVEPCPRVEAPYRNKTLLRWAFRQASRHVPIDEALREQEAWDIDVDGNQSKDRFVVEYAYRRVAEGSGSDPHTSNSPKHSDVNKGGTH